jgi:hypothetical protein
VGLGVLGSLNRQNDNSVSQGNVERRANSDQASSSLPGVPLQLPTPAHSIPMAPTVLYVTASILNVRAQPQSSAIVLLKAPQGTAVVAVAQIEGWYEVQLNNGSTGWMSADYLSASAPAPILEPTDQAPDQRAAAIPQPTIDRNAVVRALIAESQRSYPGNCPCPENRMRNGRRCGGNSAWSKGGGYSPLCYPSDVTQRMIYDYVARQR